MCRDGKEFVIFRFSEGAEAFGERFGGERLPTSR
jgi:hypothetical protein